MVSAQKLADKTLQGLSITSQLQGRMMDQKFAAERIKASEDARKANEELQKIKNAEAVNTQNTYKAYEKQLDDLQKEFYQVRSMKTFPCRKGLY